MTPTLTFINGLSTTIAIYVELLMETIIVVLQAIPGRILMIYRPGDYVLLFFN